MGRAGLVAFGSVVAIAAAVILGSGGFRPVEKMAGAILAAAYLLIAARALRAPAPPTPAYFVVQNVLAAALVWLGRGAAILIPTAIVTHAALTTRRRWVVLIACLQAANCVLMAGYLRGWSEAPRIGGGMVAAEVFVIVFAEVVAGERRARAELRDAHDKLAAYASQAEELATIRERNRLARDLHDSLGHYLTVIHVQLQAAASQMDVDADRAKDALAKAARLAHEGLEDVRRSVAALRPSPLDGQPFADAIRRLVDELASSGTPARLEVRGAPQPLSSPVELALYRAAQEALTNVRKHARARDASVLLEYAADLVRLSVHDDGAANRPIVMGFGLVGVRERVRLVRGEFEIRQGDGLTVTITVPLSA